MLRTDGLLHLETSALMVCILGVIAPVWVAAVGSMMVGLMKEIYDMHHEGHSAEWHDVACDAIGVLCGMLIVVAL